MCPTEKVQQLTLFPEGTLDLASLLVLPGSEKARKMTVTSGRKLLEYSRRSDPVGLLARMLLGTSVWGSTTCYLTWKAKVTKQSRLYFQLVPSTPRTDETGCSLWPTLRANKIGGESSPGFSPTLEQTVRMWPTPHANCHTGAGEKGEGGPNLQTAVKMWPTPTTNDAKNASLPPAARDWDIIPGALMREGHTAQEGRLNPEWVECLMNFPPKWTEV